MSDPMTNNPMPAGGEPSSEPASKPGVGQAVSRLLRQPRFLVAVGVLLVCAVGFNAAAQALQLHFRKQRVELRVPALDDKATGVPRVIANRWVQINDDLPMSGDMEKALGTKQYLNRVYIDSRAVRRSPAEIQGMSKERVGGLLADASPEALLRLHVAYYSGMADTVAHIPDRCMVADGFRPSNPGVITFSAPVGPEGQPESLQYRFTTFEDTTSQARVTRNVGYLFHANGSYTESPYEVRKRLQNLFETYGYYAKVELMTEQPGKAADDAAGRSSKAMNEFYAALLPELEKCLPDWRQVTGGK